MTEITLKEFLEYFKGRTEKLPVQMESKEMGNCYYNWHQYFIRKMERYLGAEGDAE